MAGYEIIPEGDSAVLVVFGDQISPEINRKVTATADGIREAQIPGVTDMIPAYCSLLIQYDPLRISYESLRERIGDTVSKNRDRAKNFRRMIQIPVCYGGEYGPDLEKVAEHAGLNTEEVIRIHSERDYLVYMLGFLPGFCYLGGLDERIHTPRLRTPRLRIPAGSVGIGGTQTGIYPMDSPGGWQLMGRTPVRAYDQNRKQPILFQAGDLIRFVPIRAEAYRQISREIENGNWQPVVSESGETE